MPIVEKHAASDRSHDIIKSVYHIDVDLYIGIELMAPCVIQRSYNDAVFGLPTMANNITELIDLNDIKWSGENEA